MLSRLGAMRAALALLATVATGCTVDRIASPGASDRRDARTIPVSPKVRHFYIAADEVPWNYAPAGYDQVTGQPFGEDANVFVANGPDRIGSTYIKALYREYTDADFTTLKPRAAAWQHLGVLGPVLRVQVGDTMRIVFRNNTTLTVSLHPHGVFYNKDSEGSDYDDGTGGSDKGDGVVPPGGTHVYTWIVPERSGPGPADGSSILWMYHSHTDEVRDTNAGLIGPIIVTRKGQANADGDPVDVDRQFVVMFSVLNENQSWYLQRNVATYATRPNTVKYDEEFEESNLMHSMNGYVFGNMPLETITMRVGERVRWYVMSMGTEVDLHTPHWHGQSVLVAGLRTDVVELLPASMKVADMVPDNPGTWLFHCHVNDHITAGMIGRFRVLP